MSLRNVCCCIGIGIASVVCPTNASATPSDDGERDPSPRYITNGATVRLGSSVGFLREGDQQVTALGFTVAGGRRWGRLAIEAELSYLELYERGTRSLIEEDRSPFTVSIGDAQRLGTIARLDVVRGTIIDPSLLVALFAEGGAAVAWNTWYQPPSGQPARFVPADTRRIEGQAGLGVRFDLDLQPDARMRVGLLLGVRYAFSAHETMATANSSGRSALFHAGLSVTW